MKEQTDNLSPSKELQKGALQKKLYVKPQLGTVTLFADKVLAHCRVSVSGGCTSAPIDPINTI